MYKNALAVQKATEAGIRLAQSKVAAAQTQSTSAECDHLTPEEDINIFGLLLNNNIESLIHEIKEKIFKPKRSHKIFIPKKNSNNRPSPLFKKQTRIYIKEIT